MYTTATVRTVLQEIDGKVRLDIHYTGDSGETTVVKELKIQQAQALTPHYMRGVAMEELAKLNNTRTIIATVPQLPFVLDTDTPIPNTSTPTVIYMAASLPFTPGATPQDVFTLTGSSSRNVTVIGAGISTQQTTAGVNAWNLLRRSTANAGGTPTTVAAVQNDRTLPAASATCLQYTANPTAGTLVGRVWSGRVSSPAPATGGVGNVNIALDFQRNSIKLAGINDVLAFNFNGALLPAGLSVSAWFAWMES